MNITLLKSIKELKVLKKCFCLLLKEPTPIKHGFQSLDLLIVCKVESKVDVQNWSKVQVVVVEMSVPGNVPCVVVFGS